MVGHEVLLPLRQWRCAMHQLEEFQAAEVREAKPWHAADCVPADKRKARKAICWERSGSRERQPDCGRAVKAGTLGCEAA